MDNNILMIDDDKDLNEVVDMYLSNYGMTFRSIAYASLWRDEIQKEKPDLIILDIEMPGINGFDICQEIRQFDDDISILFLTNHVEENNRIQAFLKGGNDFLGKPFSLEELRLRIEARLKDKRILQNKKLFQFGDITLNLQTSQIMMKDKKIELTPVEVEIFYLLGSHPFHIYSEKDIYAIIWKEKYDQDTRMVNVHISNLRKKLMYLDAKHKYIQTIWGKGYQYIG